MNPRIMRYPGFRFHTWDEPIVVVPKDILLKLQNSKVCDFTRMPQSVEHGITRPRVGSEKPILMLLLMRHDESARVLVLCACASHKSSQTVGCEPSVQMCFGGIVVRKRNAIGIAGVKSSFLPATLLDLSSWKLAAAYRSRSE